jgi:TfoX/Sxy family transcriptional regulator of competence genes
MASDLAYVEHICDQLRGVRGVSHRKMFGEFALYVDNKVVALVCDNQLFVKITDAGRSLLKSPREGAPYPGARPHFVADEFLDDRDTLSNLITATAAALPAPKPKKASKPSSKKRPKQR